MKLMFYSSTFNQDISGWDVSNVKTMNHMFGATENFNQDISGWDISNVEDMRAMFYLAKKFNKPLNNWDVSNVKSIKSMFYGTKEFNQPLDVSKMKILYNIFDAEKFNQDLSKGFAKFIIY